VTGVWTRLTTKVNQDIDYKERKKNFKDAEPPLWEKIIIFANQQSKKDEFLPTLDTS
jgi:hypothetical protein